MAGLKPNRVKELLFELAPAGRGNDDSPPWPIEKAPQSRGNKDCRRFARAITGRQGSRMTGLNVAKGFPLPLVRPDSKDAFGKLKDSEPGSGSIHGGKLSLVPQRFIASWPWWSNAIGMKNAHFCRFSYFGVRFLHDRIELS
jgi:hypothetical protein